MRISTRAPRNVNVEGGVIRPIHINIYHPRCVRETGVVKRNIVTGHIEHKESKIIYRYREIQEDVRIRRTGVAGELIVKTSYPIEK